MSSSIEVYETPETTISQYNGLRKSITALSLLVITLAGCGDDQESSAPPTTQEQGEVTVAEPPEIAPPSEDSGFLDTLENEGGIRRDGDNLPEEPQEESHGEEDLQLFDPETDELTDVSFLPEHFTEASPEIHGHLDIMMSKDDPASRENFPAHERVPVFWRGGVEYTFMYENTPIHMEFQNPMELFINGKRYLVATHEATGEYITLEMGSFDIERDQTKWTNYFDMLPFKTDDENSGQFALGRITNLQENSVTYYDIYSDCLRGDYKEITPEVHIWSDAGLNYSPYENGFDGYFRYGVNDEQIYKDSREIERISNEGLDCDDARQMN